MQFIFKIIFSRLCVFKSDGVTGVREISQNRLGGLRCLEATTTRQRFCGDQCVVDLFTTLPRISLVANYMLDFRFTRDSRNIMMQGVHHLEKFLKRPLIRKVVFENKRQRKLSLQNYLWNLNNYTKLSNKILSLLHFNLGNICSSFVFQNKYFETIFVALAVLNNIAVEVFKRFEKE